MSDGLHSIALDVPPFLCVLCGSFDWQRQMTTIWDLIREVLPTSSKCYSTPAGKAESVAMEYLLLVQHCQTNQHLFKHAWASQQWHLRK